MKSDNQAKRIFQYDYAYMGANTYHYTSIHNPTNRICTYSFKDFLKKLLAAFPPYSATEGKVLQSAGLQYIFEEKQIRLDVHFWSPKYGDKGKTYSWIIRPDTFNQDFAFEL
jgi:hypothetical protein